MSLGLDLAIMGDLTADIEATLADMETAAMAAADEIADWGKQQLRQDIIGAGLGQNVARSWRSVVWPDKRNASTLGPTIGWYSKAPQIIEAFAYGAEIVPANGSRFLAIPTEHAPPPPNMRSRFGRFAVSRAKRVEAAERKYGRLRYVFPRGKRFGLLVADGLMATRGKRGPGFRRASDAARRGGRVINGVVMFVLVPRAIIQRRLNVGRIEDMIEREGVARFAAAFDRITQAHFPEYAEAA
ncbi:MAG: DUF6441 family protein [Caulobacterales bacterium]|uniref:DUF6441 family protein n=1 Tax=Glycocaulis sp. TaxID=1969725 RepID=UPI003F9F0BD7